MSGIIGITGIKPERARLEEMLTLIRHRGPESSRIRVFEDGGAAACEMSLGPRSSSALAGEERPMVLLDGEIYNPRDEEVSNVEFIRRLYRRKGRACFSELDGSFACAVMDENETILVRDAVGSRPLIYDHGDGSLVFASEAKCLLGHTSQVQELPPGHIYSSNDGLMTFPAYSPEVPTFSTPEEAADILEHLMVNAVRKRMADGAVKGVALSGGLDSSIIAAIAKTFNPAIRLFSTTIQRYPSKDIGFARKMADFLGLEHHIYEITDTDITSFIPDAVWYMETFDEDCVSGAIANFYTSKMISRYTNAILVGEGADELFGGYFRELKNIPDERQKQEVARKLVAIAYNTALRRLDRSWMANSVSYRTPFLDPEVVAFSHTIPMDLKLRYDEAQGREVEKWILRRALSKWLPPEITERPKLRFAGGTGVDDLMDELTAGRITEKDFAGHPETENGLTLSSPKELHYYRIFRDNFPPGYETMVVRWDPFK